jgi:hypothetical protein
MGGTRKELHHAESEKAPLHAPYRSSPLSRLFDRRGPLRVPDLSRKEAAAYKGNQVLDIKEAAK